MKARLWRLLLALVGFIAFVTVGIELESRVGIPFAVTYRVACAGTYLFFIAKIGSDYPGERWPRIALLIALVFNLGLFLWPLARLPASKGDILLFGAPDAAIMFAARIASYRATDDHQRAVRQQMILGLALTLAFCAIILSILLIPPPRAH